MSLQIQTILQAQRPKLFFGELARQAALHLTTELLHAFMHNLTVDFIVLIHAPNRGIGDTDRE